MRKRKTPSPFPSGSTSQPPPWQVLVLVANHLDPKTLALSSCVSKSWSISMSSDHLWKPIVTTHFPSLSSIRQCQNHTSVVVVPYRSLYALGRVSLNRRLRKPPAPVLSLHNLIFIISFHNRNSDVYTVVKPGSDLNSDPNGVFRFDLEVCSENLFAVDGLRATWNVVLEGYGGVFTMMDCEGKGEFVGSDGWFSEELPHTGCCSGGGGTGSGLVADLSLGVRGEGADGKVVVEKVGVGMLSVICWRYLSVDDALRYLQHFLMPSHLQLS